MNERLLQFIWQFQYFNKQGLVTSQGDELQILKPGTWNHHQGPDFSEASIRIANTTWVGNIEIHIRSSDWYRHHHETDNHYANVILHVVWEEDTPVYDRYGHLLPGFVLQNRVPRHLLNRYRQMMDNTTLMPCSGFLPALNNLAWIAWKERLAAERLERKSAEVLHLFQQTNRHWEEVFWWLLAANFGIRVNAAHFQLVAQTLPLPVLARHKNHLPQLEALLLGQANLLSAGYTDDYAVLLQKEYIFLKTKYQLQPVNGQPAFLRMRPAAFPTIRLAQLAMLVFSADHLFAQVKEIREFTAALQLFNITASNYWHTHYRFDELSVYRPKQLGDTMAGNIMVNTVIPLLFAYGLYVQDEAYKSKAVQWLYQLPSEHNNITDKWQRAGIANHTALDSQALIELTNYYCTHKRCLDCAVGNKILNK
jgi:hypothetical protein